MPNSQIIRNKFNINLENLSLKGKAKNKQAVNPIILLPMDRNAPSDPHYLSRYELKYLSNDLKHKKSLSLGQIMPSSNIKTMNGFYTREVPKNKSQNRTLQIDDERVNVSYNAISSRFDFKKSKIMFNLQVPSIRNDHIDQHMHKNIGSYSSTDIMSLMQSLEQGKLYK